MIRVGIAGFGKIGQLRAKILNEFRDVEVIGVFDPKKPVNNDYKYYPTFEELLSLDLDAIFLCAFNTVLAEYTTKA